MEEIQKNLEKKNKEKIKKNLFKKLSFKLQSNLAKPNLDTEEAISDDFEINEKNNPKEALMINLMPEGTSPKGDHIFLGKKNIKIIKKKNTKTPLKSSKIEKERKTDKSSKIEKERKTDKSNSKNFIIDSSNYIFKTGDLESKLMKKKKKDKIFKTFTNRGKSAKTHKKKKNNTIFSSRCIFQKKSLFEEHKSFISIKHNYHNKKSKKKKKIKDINNSFEK